MKPRTICRNRSHFFEHAFRKILKPCSTSATSASKFCSVLCANGRTRARTSRADKRFSSKRCIETQKRFSRTSHPSDSKFLSRKDYARESRSQTKFVPRHRKNLNGFEK